jgi:hypothetical protein
VKGDGRQTETQIYQAMGFCDTEEGVAVKGIYHATARIARAGTSLGAVLRDYYDGSGMRSGAFDMQWSMGELRFWNQVSDAAEGDWAHSTVTRVDRRFDASFNFPQLSRDGNTEPGLHRQALSSAG